MGAPVPQYRFGAPQPDPSPFLPNDQNALRKMAATFWRHSKYAWQNFRGKIFSPYKPHSQSLPNSTTQSQFLQNTQLKFYYRSQILAMAQQDPQINGFEIAEPSPKVQKLDQTGFNGLLRVKKLSEKAVLPFRASPLSAGYDLCSATEVTVPARGKALVPTDLSIAIPEGTYARIAPRSGLAWKNSIDVLAGVVDADYRGPVGVILFNHSDTDFEVKAGDRVAQLIIEVIMKPEVVEVEDLDSTVRGAGGFGSTGV